MISRGSALNFGMVTTNDSGPMLRVQLGEAEESTVYFRVAGVTGNAGLALLRLMSAYCSTTLRMPARSAMVTFSFGSKLKVFEYWNPCPMVLICSIVPWSREITLATSGKRPVELRMDAMSPRFGEPGLVGAAPGLGGPGGLGFGN